MSLHTLRQDWFSNVRNDLLAGLVVALALIPEAIAFSIIAGVDPKVGLYASFSIATLIAFVGGRPGMISAATGAMALVMVTLVKSHGLDYLLAATVLTGVFQIIAGWLQLGRLMRFVSRSVVTGFVNALAILIFMAQLPELTNVSWHVYAMTAAGLGIIYGLPYLTKAVPSPLVTIVVLTIVSIALGLDIRTVGDMGQLPDSLPSFLIPNVPFTLETLLIILPYSLTLMVVGLLESLMTATIVDDLTDTRSDKNQECVGQGMANIATGFIGGMAGCAMIGQSVINVKSGGRGRLSTLVAGVVLLILVVFLGEWVRQIPMAALVAVMIMVSIGTFNWGSIKNLREHPRSSSVVMIATVVVTVATHDLAKGVLTGVLLSGFFFAQKVGQLLRVTSRTEDEGRARAYQVTGQVFFASAERFAGAFDYKEVLDTVSIDVSRAHFWDITAVSALDKVVLKFRREGTEVEVTGLNEASATLVDRFAVHDKDGADDMLMDHSGSPTMNIDQKILACADGTPVSESVADHAAWAARRLGAPLELLHVLDRHTALPAGQDHSGAIGLDAQEKLLDKLTREDEARTRTAREAGRQLLNRLRERALAAGAGTVDTRLRHGDIEETLAEQQEGSRLLVLGRAGSQAGMAAPGLGKHLEWVVRSVKRPVLVATESYREPTRVLFAFDGSSVTRKGVEMLAASPLLKGLPLVLLMAGAPGSTATRQLELAAQTLKNAGIDTSFFIVQGAPQEAIARELNTPGFDLLVMGAYSHSPLRSLFAGSKTSELLKASRVPTLLLR